MQKEMVNFHSTQAQLERGVKWGGGLEKNLVYFSENLSTRIPVACFFSAPNYARGCSIEVVVVAGLGPSGRARLAWGAESQLWTARAKLLLMEDCALSERVGTSTL